MGKSAGTTKWIVLLVVIIILLIIIRIGGWYGTLGVLTGAKPLRDVHPWDYIAMIVTIIVVIAALAYAWQRWRGKS